MSPVRRQMAIKISVSKDFDLRSSIVLRFLIAAYQVWIPAVLRLNRSESRICSSKSVILFSESQSDMMKIQMEMYRKALEQVTGTKFYNCQYCGKSVTRQADLVKHERTHTGEKPHVCEVCDKRFSDPSALYRHRRVHTGEKPYGCTFCEKTFAEQSVLNQHLRTHTGERPFRCETCGKTFAGRSAWWYHVRRTHNQKT